MKSSSKAARGTGLHTITQEKAAHKIAAALSKMLGIYVDPYTLHLWPAIGYWAQTTQDVQRWTGTFPRPELPNLTYSIGSWELTLSRIASGCRFEVTDERDNRKRDNDFQIEEPQ